MGGGMYRTIYHELVAWKARRERKPLILMGARQVGKTTCLKKFAEQSYENSVYLNFDSDSTVHDLFKDSIDPSDVIRLISIDRNVEIEPGKTLIIFDEIQECPNALNSLKYVCEKAPQYHVCAAGSLLGVKLKNTGGFPVGKVDFMHLYPFSFYEFLYALDEKKLCEFMRAIEKPEPLPEIIHNKLNKYYLHYLFVGGMPEAVLRYRDTRSLAPVREVQEAILAAYVLDFSKHAPKGQVMRIHQIWDSLPNQLAKENSKFMYSVIRKGARAKEFELALQWLIEAGLLLKVSNLSKPALPLKAYAKLDIFKMYCLDVGLLGAMVKLPQKILAHDDEILQEFKGVMAENYCAQVLVKTHEDLFFWSSEGRAEVDFVIQTEAHIYPLEVKSGRSTKKKSLAVYEKKYRPKLKVRASLLNLKRDETLLNCPLYLLDRLRQFL